DSYAGSFAGGVQVAPPGPAARALANANATYLSVVARTTDPLSARGQDLVRDIRNSPAPRPVLVAGSSADLVDAKASLARSLPWAFGTVVLSLFVMLFLLTDSLVMPLKALVLNTMRLSATYGALVWIFQDGHLRSLFGDFIVADGIIWTVPLLLFCI